MNALEVAAGKIVAHYLSGSEIPKDVPGAPDMTVDFEVVLPDSRTIALEVTTAADGKVLSLLAAGSKREWSAPGLTNDWQVGVAHGKDIQVAQVLKQILGPLEVYEQDGLTEVATWTNPRWNQALAGLSSQAAAAARTQFDLGVVVARSFGAKQGSVAQIYITAHGGATSDVGQVTELVEAAAEANRDKLAAAAGDEKHLFVWLNPSYAAAELAVATQPAPPAPPAIPSGVDVVWLATQGGRGHGDMQLEKLWRVRRSGSWEQLDPSSYGG